jgi:chromosome partitioning protein
VKPALRITISNQRGGVAKTTTAVVLARCFADRGQRVLLIDTDPQGSISVIISAKPNAHLSDMLMHDAKLSDCITKVHNNIDLLASNRDTNKAEDLISTQMAREYTFQHVFPKLDSEYDIVLIDVAPSIGLFQTCAMMYTRNVLVPVAMETLSVQGATASLNAAESLNQLFDLTPPVRTVGFVPVSVNARRQMTDTVLAALNMLSQRFQVPVLPQIRTDTDVQKAARDRQFLQDYNPKSKALEDYNALAEALLRGTEESPITSNDATALIAQEG